jgi:hypothetical protein
MLPCDQADIFFVEVLENVFPAVTQKLSGSVDQLFLRHPTVAWQETPIHGMHSGGNTAERFRRLTGIIPVCISILLNMTLILGTVRKDLGEFSPSGFSSEMLGRPY